MTTLPSALPPRGEVLRAVRPRARRTRQQQPKHSGDVTDSPFCIPPSHFVNNRRSTDNFSDFEGALHPLSGARRFNRAGQTGPLGFFRRRQVWIVLRRILKKTAYRLKGSRSRSFAAPPTPTAAPCPSQEPTTRFGQLFAAAHTGRTAVYPLRRPGTGPRSNAKRRVTRSACHGKRGILTRLDMNKAIGLHT